MLMTREFSAIPYVVFEKVLLKLKGQDLLSAACVCKNWNIMCITYGNRKDSNAIWRDHCFKDLFPGVLNNCVSGNVEENWRLVYKASLIHRGLSHRVTSYSLIPLNKRFVKEPTGVHLLGGFLVLVQANLLQVYNILSGDLINTQILQFPIISSLVKRKVLATCSVSLPCDVLVLFCGGQLVSHIALVPAAALPLFTAVAEPLTSEGSKYMSELTAVLGLEHQIVCELCNRHVKISPTDCLDLVPEGGLKPQYVACVGGAQLSSIADPSVEMSGLKNPGLLTRTIGNNLTVDLIKERTGSDRLRIFHMQNKFQSIAAWIEGVILASSDRGWDARLVSVNGNISPVVALVQSNEQLGKHVGLYRVEHD